MSDPNSKRMQGLTVFCSIYNEAHRLEPWLRHCSKWADCVLVYDKGSTDGSVEMAREHGATVVGIPFSEPGGEGDILVQLVHKHGTDWQVWSTPSEFFPPVVPMYFRALIDSDDGTTDGLYVNSRIFAFGSSDPNTPYGDFPHFRLFHRSRALMSPKVHQLFNSSGRAKTVNDPNAFVLHLTHPNFSSFMTRQIGYSKHEVEGAEDLIERARQAILSADSRDEYFRSNPSANIMHHLAWKVSMYMVALSCLSSKNKEQIDQIYKEQARTILSAWGLS